MAYVVVFTVKKRIILRVSWQERKGTISQVTFGIIVEHPSQWPFCGYNEIQEPKRKNVLINYEQLKASLGLGSYDLVKFYHKKWVEEYLGNGKKTGGRHEPDSGTSKKSSAERIDP